MTILFNKSFPAYDEIENNDSIGHLWLFRRDESDHHADGVTRPVHLDYLGPHTRLTIKGAEILHDALGALLVAHYDDEHEEPADYDEYAAARGITLEDGDRYGIESPDEPEKLTTTNGWNPGYPETSLVYDADGNCLGRLVSIDPDTQAGGGIQEHSQGDLPVSDLRVGDELIALVDEPEHAGYTKKGDLLQVTSVRNGVDFTYRLVLGTDPEQLGCWAGSVSEIGELYGRV